MPQVTIENHPQLQQINRDLLAGRTTRQVAATLNPKLHFATIARYKKQKAIPALQREARITKLLSQQGIASEHGLTDQQSQATAAATMTQLAALPLLNALATKNARLERGLEKTANKGLWREMAALDSAQTRAMTLQAQIEGLLQASPGSTLNIHINQAAAGQPVGVTVDTTCVELD